MALLQRFYLISLALLLLAGCSAKKVTPTSNSPWTEETVTFTSGINQLEGVLTLPNTPSPYPAIVLVSGSANEGTGLRPGVDDLYMMRQAHNIVQAGFAILRYNPPGDGNSTGYSRFESMEDRAKESMAAINYLQTRRDI